jgi:hypothetical protein
MWTHPHRATCRRIGEIFVETKGRQGVVLAGQVKPVSAIRPMKPELHTSDIQVHRRGPAFAAEPAPRVRAVEPVPTVDSADSATVDVQDEPLKCVWSGYPNYERDCRSRIPASVVVKAWQREMHLKGTVEGFFYFSWRSGVWLGFGAADGGVRGVYCPTHCSERDSREIREDDPTRDGSTGISLQ